MRANMTGGNVTLSDLCNEKLAVFLPSIVYLGVMAAIGVVGNVFVVKVYGFSLRKHSTFRHFILVLAMYDLTACCLGMPGLIIEMGMMYRFYSGVGCKVLRYGLHTIAAGTSLTHAMVGVDRYRRVCRATQAQITVHSARSCTYIIMVISLVIAMPAVFMYDSDDVGTRLTNVSGHRCVISAEYQGSIYPAMYSFAIILLIMITTCTMIILYTLIGRKLVKRLEFLKSIESGSQPETGLQGKQQRSSTLKVHHNFKNRVAPWQAAEPEMSERESAMHTVTHDHESLSNIGASANKATERTKSAKLRSTRNKEMASRKVTLTTFAITVAFICSFMPLQVLELMTHFDGDIARNMTFTQEVFYRLGFLSYTLDNIVNPIIYAFLDTDFRHGCKELFRNCPCRKIT